MTACVQPSPTMGEGQQGDLCSPISPDASSTSSRSSSAWRWCASCWCTSRPAIRWSRCCRPMRRRNSPQQLRAAYGFDRPLPVQFGLWLWRALHGDLGNSIATGRPVLTRGDARGRQHRDAGDCRRAHRLHARAVVRPDRRLFPRHLDRQARDLVRDRRRLGAALLARHGAGDHLLGAAELAARGRRRARRLRRLGLGLGASALSDPAGDHDLGDPDGHRHPHRARADRRYPEPGFRRGAARQGPARDRACSATSSRTPRRPRSR